MIKDRFTESMANIMLRQMGAVEILNKPAYINKVKFKLSDGSNVTYIYEIKEGDDIYYEIKEGDDIYLNRVRPYSHFLGTFHDEEELVDAIRRDYAMFKVAVTSKNFEQYQRMAKGMEDMNSELEKMFMSRETSREDLDRIEKSNVDIYNDKRSLKKNSAVDMEELEKTLNID